MLLKEEINKYLNYCKFQKELNDKTIKAYKADLEQFITCLLYTSYVKRAERRIAWQLDLR